MARSKASPPDGAAIAKAIAEAEATFKAQGEERRYAKAHASLAEHKALVRTYEREIRDWEARYRALLDLKQNQLDHEVVVDVGSDKGPSLSAAALVVSDVHADERVLPENVNGRNRYNPNVCEQRLDSLWRNTVKLVDSARAYTRIEHLTVFLLGDLFSGWIHKELMSTTEMAPAESVVWLQPRLVAGLDYLAKHGGFREVRVVCKVGNHSRITEKEYTVPERVSLEWVLYNWMARHYQDHKTVRFNLTPSHLTFVELAGVRIRTHHGNAFRYGGGVGGILVPFNRIANQWDSTERADMDVIGHWHTYQPGRRLINGSLIGYNAYAARYGFSFEPPQQAFFLVSKKHRRVTLQAPVFVE